MKKIVKSLWVLAPVAGILLFLLSSFRSSVTNMDSVYLPGDKFAIPEHINAIFDNKCFGCHNIESTNDKGKEKLLIDQLPELSKAKLVAKLEGISETVGKNEMPPKKFLDKNPDKALTTEESKQLKDWVASATEELMN